MSEAVVQSDPGELASETLTRILAIAAAERAARNSAIWKTNLEMAFDVHGGIVESLYEALYAELDRRANSGAPVTAPKRPDDPLKVAKKHILTQLKARLPDLVSQALDDDF